MNKVLQFAKVWSVFLVLLYSLCSCSSNKTFNSKVELLDYLKDPDNGYLQSKSVNGVDFILMYRPTDLLVLQEIEGKETGPKLIDSLRKHYEQYLYFNLSLSKHKKDLLSVVPNNQAEYGALVNQLAFQMREKIHLFTQHKDTLQLVDFVFPRMYGMSKSTNMMFIFSKEEKTLNSNFLQFSISNMDLKTGEVKFKILSENIKNEPQLSFKN